MEKYVKPKILSSEYYPEPVETGCCLRSCGGLSIGNNYAAKSKNNVELQKLNNEIEETEK